jgi:Bacterial membrane protein YfhO
MPRPDGGRLRTLLCLGILGLLPFALFWRVSLFLRVFADGDLYSYNYPLLCTIGRQWKAGEIPLWNPYIFGGTPLLGNMQGGAFYPLNALLLLNPTWKAYQYSILLHYSLAGIFAYAYTRTLPLSRLASLYGGTVFMLGGFGMGTLGHVSTLRTYPWLPLVLLGLEMWRRSPDRRHLVLAGTAMGMMLLAGHPQIPLYAMALATAYVGFFVPRAAKGERGRLVAGYLGSLCLAAGLAAVQILPTLQLAAQEYLRPTDRSYEYFVNYSLSPILLLDLIFPRILPANESELAVYVGVSTLVLVVVAWYRRSQLGAHRLFFSAAGGIALVLAFGRFSPLSRLLFRLPLYNLFTAPARNLFEFDFCIAVLAAMGFHASSRSGAAAAERRAVFAFTVSACLAAIAAHHLRAYGPALDVDLSVLSDAGWIRQNLLGRLPIVLGSLVCVWLLPGSNRRGRLVAVALWALLVVDLASFGTTIYELYPPSVYTSEPRVAGFLKTEGGTDRILTLEQPEDDDGLARAMLSPDWNAALGVESVNGFDSMMLRQIDEASGHVMPTYGLISGVDAYGQAQFRGFMDVLNVGIVLMPASKGGSLPATRYRLVYDDGTVRAFRNVEALPRYFLASGMKRVSRGEAVAALASAGLASGSFNPRRLALVDDPSGALTPGERGWPWLRGRTDPETAGSVVVVHRRSGLVRLRVRSGSPVVLVSATSYSRGWKAYVDGAEVPVLRAFGVAQAVGLPAGEHEIELSYAPGSFRVGLALSALSALVAAGMCFPPFRAKRSHA